MKYLALAVLGFALTICAIKLDSQALQLASWVCYVVAFVGNKMKYDKENA
jgi:hypothetical protein